MMKSIGFAIVILSLALAAGCAQEETAERSGTAAADPRTAAAEDLTPEQLGEIGARLSNEPERAEQILSEHGLNRDSFEQQIRDVTEDPEASRRYAEAFNRGRA